MRKLVVLSFAVLAIAFAQSEYNFRRTTWGMNEEEVKATEDGELVSEDEGMLLYMGQVAGLDCYIGYKFVDHQLVRGKYIFSSQYSDKKEYISDFVDVQDFLMSNYGRASKDTICWFDDPNKYDAFEWGNAVAAGKLVLRSEWNTLTSNILLILYGEDSKIRLIVQYDDAEFD